MRIKNFHNVYLIIIIFLYYLPVYISQESSPLKLNQSFDPENVLVKLDMVLRNSTIKFLEKFFEYQINTTTGCDIWNYTQIYDYSFRIDNTLGDYTSCLRDKDTQYFFFVLFENNTLTDEFFRKNTLQGFSYYFKDLMYTQNYIFSMCVPNCIISFNDSIKINPFNITEDQGKAFKMISYNTQQIFIQSYNKDKIIKIYISAFYSVFLFLSIFFALLPTYERIEYLCYFLFECFCCCLIKKNKKKTNFKDNKIHKSKNKVKEVSTDIGLSQFQNSNLKNKIKNMLIEDEEDSNNSSFFDRNKYYNTEEEDNNPSINFNEISEFHGRKNLNVAVNNDTNMDSDLNFPPPLTTDSRNSNINKNFTKFYKVVASIFSLSKNIKRIFKPTNQKNNIHSSYINDDSLAFMNGCKAINLFCVTYCTIFWIFLESPVTKHHQPIKIDFFNQGILTLPILYYLYWSIYLTYAFNGFSFGYKFLSHMNSRHLDSNNRDNTDIKLTIKKILSFVLPLFFRYFLFFFLIFNVYNIQYLLSLGSLKAAKEIPGIGTGPLFYIYKEISNYTLSQIKYFLMLYANFKMIDTKLAKTSIYVFFFVFINEIQYFFISLIILIIYYYKKNLGFILLLFAYLYAIFARAVFLVFREAEVIGTYGYKKYYFGIEIYSFRFTYGLPVYFIGVIFGILYFEYNTVDDLGITGTFVNEPYNSSGENLSYSDYLKQLNDSSERNTRTFIKIFASSKFLQNLFIIISSTVLFVLILNDNIFLFRNIRESGFKNYKFSWWEKIYSFIELDFLAILIFLLVFKYAIFNNSQLKKFLSSDFWIPFSRLYFVINCFLSPITYFFILNLDYPIKFKFSNVLFLSLSVLFLLYYLGIFISLMVEVPLKVGFKKIVNLCLQEKNSSKNSDVDCSNNIQT